MSGQDPSPRPRHADLLASRVLVRNGVWNVVGLSLPLAVAVVAIPPLVSHLGTDRFGLLAIIWTAIGYFGLFDLGLGLALTRLVAERLGQGRTEALPRIVWTAIALMGALGLTAAVSVAAAAPWLVRGVLAVPPALQGEAELALMILAATLPFVILSAAFIGVLEAHQDFAAINTVRIPVGALTFLGPLIAVQHAPSLVAATGVLAATRLLACLAYLAQCLRRMPTLRSPAFDRTLVRPLVAFGGWLTVSNLVSPLMVHFDRFVIGALLTMSAVAYYATPYEVVTRFRVVPVAMVAVLFPALATAFASDRTRLSRLFGRAAGALLLVMLPLMALVALFAPEGLALWLGPEFAANSAGVLRWLAVGVFVNSLGRVGQTLVQGVGRPDVGAKLHLLEAIPYAVALWLLIPRFGILGAAAAWTGRVALDTAALLWIGGRLVPALRRETRRALLLTAVGAASIALFALVPDLAVRSVLAVALLAVVAWLGYRQLRAVGWLPGARGVAESRGS
ncbi:MAG TPA: flippase [Thermodesulfobacteriota bacterium]